MVKKVGSKKNYGIFSTNSSDSTSSPEVDSAQSSAFASVFSDTMKKMNLEEELEELLNFGEQLKYNLTLKGLEEYKGKIKKFLKELFERTSILDENAILEDSEEKKKRNLVEQLNQELDELTNLLKSEQKDVLKILGRMDGLKGILIDLYS